MSRETAEIVAMLEGRGNKILVYDPPPSSSTGWTDHLRSGAWDSAWWYALKGRGYAPWKKPQYPIAVVRS